MGIKTFIVVIGITVMLHDAVQHEITNGKIDTLTKEIEGVKK